MAGGNPIIYARLTNRNYACETFGSVEKEKKV